MQSIELFLRNKGNEKVNYAHVDSINIFQFIDEILIKKRNNPVKTFEKFDEIEQWLKDQWAGIFREFLSKRTQQNQIRTLTTEVAELQEINKTLKTYLEALLTTLQPKSDTLIDTESKRLKEATVRRELEENGWYRYLNIRKPLSIIDFIDVLKKAVNKADYLRLLKEFGYAEKDVGEVDYYLTNASDAIDDINSARVLLGLAPLITDSDKKSKKNK